MGIDDDIKDLKKEVKEGIALEVKEGILDKLQILWEDHSGKITGTVILAALGGLVIGYFFEQISVVAGFLWKIVTYFI
jgi:hypothetical protein